MRMTTIAKRTKGLHCRARFGPSSIFCFAKTTRTGSGLIFTTVCGKSTSLPSLWMTRRSWGNGHNKTTRPQRMENQMGIRIPNLTSRNLLWGDRTTTKQRKHQNPSTPLQKLPPSLQTLAKRTLPTLPPKLFHQTNLPALILRYHLRIRSLLPVKASNDRRQEMRPPRRFRFPTHLHQSRPLQATARSLRAALATAYAGHLRMQCKTALDQVQPMKT